MNFDFFNSIDTYQSREVIFKSSNITSNSFRQELQERVNTIINRVQTRHAEFTLDRFEGNFAILENRNNGQMINVPINKIPPNSKEGVILRFENNIYFIDHNLTEKSRTEIRDLMNELRK